MSHFPNSGNYTRGNRKIENMSYLHWDNLSWEPNIEGKESIFNYTWKDQI